MKLLDILFENEPVPVRSILEPSDALPADQTMPIQVLDENSMKQMAYKRDYIVVSIADTDKDRIEIPKGAGLKGIHELNFYDVNASEAYGYPGMTAKQAWELVVWIMQFKPEEGGKWPLVVVHCKAGVSRSAAVAAALWKRFNGDNESFFGDTLGFTPNKHVYNLVEHMINRYER